MTPGRATEGGPPREAVSPDSPEAPRAPFGERLTAARGALGAYVAALVPPRGAVEADEVMQETLTRALRSQDTHDRARPLLPWLKRMALRAFLDLREHQRRGPGPLPAGTQVAAAPALDELALREEVEVLLSVLPPVEREVLERFHRRGQGVAAIAADLGLPAGTVKSHLHRARRRLAPRVEPRDAGGEVQR